MPHVCVCVAVKWQRIVDIHLHLYVVLSSRFYAYDYAEFMQHFDHSEAVFQKMVAF